VDPVTVSVAIARPREEVFDYLADLANHAEFTDHYLVDWHLTREDSRGLGAGARFRVKAPGRFNWGEVTFVEVEAPYRIAEAGTGGKYNRIRSHGEYRLTSLSAGVTQVAFTLETEPANLADRLLESLGARWWLARQNRRALRRLRGILEHQGGRRGKRVTVAAR